MSLPSNLLETTQADIERLIADRTQEGPHLDFKRDLPGVWDNSAKHELLADVTAFANSGGATSSTVSTRTMRRRLQLFARKALLTSTRRFDDYRTSS